MIYKFVDHGNDSELELEAFNDTNQSVGLPETICFSIKMVNDDNWNLIHLTKPQVYKMIGALHLLHKEMK